MNKWLFKDFRLDTADDTLLLSINKNQQAFLQEGNVIGGGRYHQLYFMPFAFQQVGDNTFKIIHLKDVTPAEIGLDPAVVPWVQKPVKHELQLHTSEPGNWYSICRMDKPDESIGMAYKCEDGIWRFMDMNKLFHTGEELVMIAGLLEHLNSKEQAPT